MATFTYGADVPTARTTTTLTRHDSAGAATSETLSARNVYVNTSSIVGTGASDTLFLTANRDNLFVYDDFTVAAADRATVSGSGRWSSGATAPTATTAIEVFYGGGRSDIINLTHEASGPGYPVAVTIFGGAGADVVWSADFGDTINGDAGDDTLRGGGGGDTIYGGADIDTLFGDAGNDVLYGGNNAGADDGSADTFYGGDGLDTIVDTANAAFVDGGLGNDIVTVTYTSGGGTIWGGGDDDVVTLLGTYAAVVVDAGAGNDVVNAGGTGANVDTVYGGAGFDTISTGAGADTIYGGADADTAYGGAGIDRVFGDAGDDWLFGGTSAGIDDGSADTFYGGDGIDRITDTANAAFADGGIGDDEIVVAYTTGSGTLWGGDGADYIDASGVYTRLLIDGGLGDDYIVAGGTGVNVDTAYGGTGFDLVATGIGNDTLYGGDDGDALYGGSGLDQLFGGNGADYLYGEAGNDTLNGGANADWYNIGRGEGVDTIVENAVSENHVLIYGTFDFSSATYFASGSGIDESGGTTLAIGYVLGSNAIGDINLTISGGNATLSVVGDTTSVVFATAGVLDITLWNSDATGAQVQELFSWNGTTYAFAGYVG